MRHIAIVAVLLTAVQAAGAEPSSFVTASPAPLVPAEAKVAMAEAGNAFAFDLYAKLRDRQGNLFFSPLSISTILTVAYSGARGETADEMAAVLRCRSDRLSQPESVHAAAALLLADLSAQNGRDCEISIANALWGRKGFGFQPAFLGLIEKNYGASLQEADFAGDPEGARQAMNAWFLRSTRGKIADFLAPGEIQPQSRLVLANAVYFKAAWLHRFDKSGTTSQDFHVAAGKAVSVPMMNQTMIFTYLDGGDFQAVGMPYRNQGFEMVILLPKSVNGLAQLEKSLTGANVAQWWPKLTQRFVIVAVPRFRVTAKAELAGVLAAMGMPRAFDRTRVDFSAMNGGKEPLWIDGIFHSALAEVNEDGTCAAAATRGEFFGAGMEEPPPVFRADHPFLFLIRDTRSGCILFLGRVVNPKA